MLTDEMRYKLMRALESNPELSQRDLARELGVSLGQVNHCLRVLIRTGLVKARNFSNSKNKAAYTYLLTPRGIEEKAEVTYQFLRSKIEEYERLRSEIKMIRREFSNQSKDRS